ncbi:DNA polymerase iota isoform X2 [Pseudophryne corroboree]|uniref:DNA polymerase iota isoform X2 n=1 Tax=Pseudophryne corroboree TaxID=495146 RepID=UPI003081C6F4
MDSPREDESEDEETDWLCREEASEDDKTAVHQRWQPTASFSRTVAKSEMPSKRIIVHLDMDCFYAQVEMIRNPNLRDKPLGVQQKYLVVTCNYEARKFGVGKCMTVTAAKEKCPQLVLVSGEDLTHYRETSYKVTELLEEFSPKVERLGFDENFVDVTELVDKRLEELDQQPDSTAEVSGHVYNDQIVNPSDWTHRRLVAGSHVAADIRAAVYSRLGLTGCAGIASNKLLSKLVSGTFKPNQQTVLFPESSSRLINSLSHVNRIPGIGYKTAQHLEGLALTSISALQSCPVAVLEKVLGASVAHRIQKLSRGEDDSPVTPSGPPQSLSEEDSFRKYSTVSEVRTKLEELLRSLLGRLSADGRSPHTLRLTLRQFSPTNKYFNRESRQCPIPMHVVQNLISASSVECSAVLSPLMEMLMKLFEKMIDVKLPFHLTLLNVCFSNLKASKSSNSSSRNSIGFYLSQKKESASDASPSSQVTGARVKRGVNDSSPATGLEHPASLSLPGDIDMDVFSQLPEDIRRELLSSPHTGRTHTSSQASACKGIQHFFTKAITGGPDCSGRDRSHSLSKETDSLCNRTDSGSDVYPGSSVGSPSYMPHGNCTANPSVQNRCADTDVGVAMDCADSGDSEAVVPFPKSIDLSVYSQLPEELQKELMTEWKHQKLTPKILVKKSHGKLKTPKGQKSPAAPQPNNLLKYFKPG